MNQTVDLTNLKEVVKITKKEEIDTYIQNHTWPNKNHASGKQHACNDSNPKGGVMDPTCLTA